MIIQTTVRPAVKKVPTSFGRLVLTKYEDITPQDTTLTREDAVSTVPEFKGDWVLFHPVYSPEELKAVQVKPYDTEVTRGH
ncbi:hypothetical protein EIP86_008624 [Pleurotus ostreatoroseus]|nr:hypothetical protein EIP86_008624 [Pleurotus ostreatoroseus]